MNDLKNILTQQDYIKEYYYIQFLQHAIDSDIMDKFTALKLLGLKKYNTKLGKIFYAK